MGDRGCDASEDPPTPTPKKKRMRSKSIKRVKLSPMQSRIKEAVTYIKPHQDAIFELPTVKERLSKVYELMSADMGDITRLWPLKLMNKDSRIRRELSEKASEKLRKGEDEEGLKLYNQALMYSCGKGIAQTLARRATHFLSSGQLNLALRDLAAALEYGCLQTELLDLLLSHHKPKNSTKKYGEKYKWAENIKEYLDTAAELKKNKTDPKKMNKILEDIVTSIETAAKEANVDQNMEVEELAVPIIKEKNPLIPAMSEAIAISFDSEKGRILKARRDIKAGELLCVDSPISSLLCPENVELVSQYCNHCFKKTKAPLPCENCCVVSFCSKECSKIAQDTYHKYECQMRLYEIFPGEDSEMFSLFMALRSITQKPLQFFRESKDDIEKYLDLSNPVHPLPVRAYLSTDYKALVNLQTHIDDLDEDIALKHYILAVFFYRSLQFAGYFGTPGRPGGGFMKKVEPLQDQELYMLRVIHQIINVQSFNTHSIRELTENFTWEKIGISINPSLALVNHSCDPNTIRCNLNKNTILVAGQHIKQGEEITDSYHVHFKNVVLSQRQYHTLKYYMFECECPACAQNWPLEDQIPDELPRIPNMETEAYFKKRTGDKKDIVKGIIDARRHVEGLMAKQDHEATLLAYGPLCEQLEIHVRKPHIYYLQARSGIAHCLWNMFCRQKSKEDEFEDTDDVTGRDHAVKIYQSDFMEKSTEKKSLVMINGEMVWPVKNDPVKDAKDEEKRRILEATKQALMNTSANLGSVKADHQAMKDTIKSMKDIAWEHAHMGKVGDLNHIITDEEFAELVKQKETENEMIKSELAKFEEEMKKVESEVKARREKEREELDKKRELEKKLREEEKEKAIAEKMKQYKEDEAKRKEERANRELEKKKRIEAEHKKKAERETKRLEEALTRRKEELKQEEDELEKLLAMVEAEDSINVDKSVDLNVEPLNNEAGNGQESAEILSKEETPTKIKNDINTKNHSVNTPKEENKVLTSKSNNSNESDKNSVWAAIRELKESALDLGGIEFTTSNEKQAETNEVVTEDAFDLFIKDIKAKAELAKKVAMAKPKEVMNENKSTTITDSNIRESNKSDNMVVNGTNEEHNDMKSNTNGIAEHDKENIKPDEIKENDKPAEPFDYVAWKKNMERFYKEENEAEMRAEAADQAYLMQLKQIINERIVKYIAESKVNDVNDGPLFKPKPKPKKVKSDKDEMTNLKHKEKERKRKKKEEKFKESEDKMKDVALKAAKIDKVVNYADQEIIRMRELITNLLQRSKLNDKEVEDLNLDEIVAQAHVDTVDNASSNDQSKHWTEEDTNKWPNQNKKQDFTNALTVLRNSAISNIDAEKLKTSITAVKEAKPETKKTVVVKDTTKTIKEKEALVNNNVSKPSIDILKNGTTKHLPKPTESAPTNVSTNNIEPKANTQQSVIPKIISEDKPAETNKTQNGIKSSNDTLKKTEHTDIINSAVNSKTQEKAVKQTTGMLFSTKNNITEDKKPSDPKVSEKVSAVTQEKKQDILPVIEIKEKSQSTPASKSAIPNGNGTVNNSDKQKPEVKRQEKPKDNVKTSESKDNNQTSALKENKTIKVTQEVTNKETEPESKTKNNYEIKKVATEKIVIPTPVKEKSIPKQEETTPIKENYSITKEPTQNIVIVKKFTQTPNKQSLDNIKEHTQNGKETKAALINKHDNTINENKVKPRDEDKTNNQPNGRPVTKIVFNEQKDETTNQKSKESLKLTASKPESKLQLNQTNKEEKLNQKPTENVKPLEPKPEIKIENKIPKAELTAIKEEVKIEPTKTEHVNEKPNQNSGIKINGDETTNADDTVKPVEILKVENKVLTKPPQNGVTAVGVSPKVEKKINLPKVPVPSSPIPKAKQSIPESPKIDKRITSPSPVRSQKVNTSVEPQPLKVPDSPKAGGVFVVTPFTFAPPPQQQMRRPPPPNFKPPPPPSMKPPPPPPLF